MDQEIEIPSHFVCPISLQLMRDPVTVSTGITYDRDCIEKWLFSSRKNTCPVTKQPLNITNNNLVGLTPNHTLRRLIQAWCTFNASRGVERIPTPKPPLDEAHAAKLLREAKMAKVPCTQLKCLNRLKSIATQGAERDKKYLESAGTIEYLAELLKRKDSSTAVQTAIEILFHFRSSEDRFKVLITNDGSEIVDSFITVLRQGSYQSRAFSTVLLRLMLNLADPIQLMALKTELFEGWVSVLADRISNQATKAALKVLKEVCPWGRNRIKAIEGGAVPVLVELLIDHSSAVAESNRACELALVVLDQLCGCAEGRAELLSHGAGLAVVSKKILRVSHTASDRAVRVLASICRFSATSRVLQEMLRVGVVAKLCLVLQVNSSLKTRNRAKEILKLHSEVWKTSSCIPPHLLASYPS